MNDFVKFLQEHWGKAAGGSIALAVYLACRGCDISVHVDPVHARTNSVPMTQTNQP